MGEHSQKFQAPKGTRDFYPADMAVRRYIESVWREVSVNHGFEEIDGPTFEHLELYTKKSGEEIAKQLFSFRRADGDTDYALRPEFTPTLARMYAARAGELPKPTKWFCLPNFFRAERPQRGRLREFQQWNIDILGDETPRADAEVIACTVGILRGFGIQSKDVTIKISHRCVAVDGLREAGVVDDRIDAGLSLLDRKSKLPPEEFTKQSSAIGFDWVRFEKYAKGVGDAVNGAILQLEQGARWSDIAVDDRAASLMNVVRELHATNVLQWCEVDFSIVRGLAYYTGTVFEVHEASGKERAIAGGGRYDGLVQLFGGPATPAVGIAMGDVVLLNVLEDRGLLPDEKSIQQRLRQRVDVFVISAKEEADGELAKIVSELRGAGLHARQSYKATRNVGKLLGDAGKCHARTAIILGDELHEKKVVVKDMESGEQTLINRDAVAQYIRSVVGR